ncbi:aminodeoxychorismate synthase component I [Conservatibacter flavescens]|uniref:Aminodeoxychorismate synthase component I n=1 Tax=Conservatibacter flavescens TaxID=28161 RepID=A0A2M8S1X1_9PAST|nr:aminodeoxychorismate synthase component I [Conservatibacter flavescens]PJG85096.1 aminodeoxychorismate synthase component I [Conservatibacter flavescens]
MIAAPFFFLIDFEQQKPLILPLEQAAKCGVFFHILGQTNLKVPDNMTLPEFQLNKTPYDPVQYQYSFERVQQELQKGNTYLLNLTAPTAIDCNYSLEQLFHSTQAPYKLWLQNEFVCFSPECFIKMQGNTVYAYPMKGTIDATLPNAAQQLINSSKELWEHHTIVDLMRNDLALIAENIQVTRFRYLERIETERGAILQTSSEICGTLPDNWRQNPLELLQKMLPAGSISGAPKLRTINIIQTVEPQMRGYYTGVFGLFDGENLYSAVAIRYIEQTPNGLQFRSGGGITAQSQCADEYQELQQKVYVPLTQRTA